MSVDPTQTSLRYVAVCDVLGFKSMLESVELKTLADRYFRLLALARTFVRELSNISPASGDRNNLVAHAVFSDTLIVWSQPLQEEEYPGDLGSVSTFFYVCNAMIMAGIHMRMPMRVGISWGQVCIHPQLSMFLGKPIAEAYNLEEEQQWIGGACHTSCVDAPHFRRVDFPWRDVVEYDVPMQKETRRLFALNWPRAIKEESLCYFDDEATNARSPSVARKYHEAKLFFTFASRKNNMSADEMRHELEMRGIRLVNRAHEISATSANSGDGK